MDLTERSESIRYTCCLSARVQERREPGPKGNVVEGTYLGDVDKDTLKWATGHEDETADHCWNRNPDYRDCWYVWDWAAQSL
jgi:hypothetical protein